MARLLGGILTGGGVSLLAWALATMRGAGTPPEPWKPTQRIVTRGPFRYTRNPIYVAFTGISLGVAALANAFWPVLLLPAALLAIQRGVIEREERYLERLFGDEYLRYKAHVRRWL
jgi:protein-S-isoprenylcysteine O-methyltransferase Ste14